MVAVHAHQRDDDLGAAGDAGGDVGFQCRQAEQGYGPGARRDGVALGERDAGRQPAQAHETVGGQARPAGRPGWAGKPGSRARPGSSAATAMRGSERCASRSLLSLRALLELPAITARKPRAARSKADKVRSGGARLPRTRRAAPARPSCTCTPQSSCVGRLRTASLLALRACSTRGTSGTGAPAPRHRSGHRARRLLAAGCVSTGRCGGLRGRHLLQLLLGDPVARPARHLGGEIDALPFRVIGRLMEVRERSK